MKKNRFVMISGVLILMLGILSCNLGNVGNEATSSNLQETEMALALESTMLALQAQEATLNAAAAVVPTSTQVVVEVPTEQPVEQPTYTPYPTYTPQEPASLGTPMGQEEPAVEPQNIQEQIKAANILVYEDVRGNPNLVPYVQETVNRMHFSGGKVVFVGDAMGNFMQQLNSAQKWDLIIVAAENRSWIRGEFWDVILDQINNNDAAVIAEIWTLDSIANGRISSFLYECGIEYQKNWSRPNNYDILDYSMYWLDTSHPLLSDPNVLQPLYTSTAYWIGDIGDLIRLGIGGDAQLVAGLYPREKSSYGTLATCMDGTVVVQTFSTHDYPRSQVSAAWENYITYTLTNHFEQQNK